MVLFTRAADYCPDNGTQLYQGKHRVSCGTHSQVLVGRLQRFGSEGHVVQDLCIGLGVLQGLSLELDGRKSSVDLLKLFLQSLFPFQGIHGGYFFIIIIKRYMYSSHGQISHNNR